METDSVRFICFLELIMDLLPGIIRWRVMIMWKWKMSRRTERGLKSREVQMAIIFCFPFFHNRHPPPLPRPLPLPRLYP